MSIKKQLKAYFSAKKKGEKETAKKIKNKLNRSIRRKTAIRTADKAFLSHIAASFFRLIETKEHKEELNATIQAYVSDEKRRDKKWLRSVKKDIYYSEFYNRINADEFFRYRFETLSRTGRKEYVGDEELLATFRRIDDPEESKIIHNKFKAYCYLQKYYKRDAILINTEQDKDSFITFCSQNEEFFTKPLFQYGGKGVQRWRQDIDGTAEDIFARIIGEPVIVEQPICQDPKMAKYHAASINTIRIVTVNKEKIYIVQASVRFGMGGSIVDNGCISAAVDPVSGIIISQGRAAHTTGRYLFHPDTNEQILGSQIPNWTGAVELAYELANMFKRQRVIGWDLALSSKGWVIVEANTKPAVQTLAGDGIGARGLFEEITN